MLDMSMQGHLGQESSRDYTSTQTSTTTVLNCSFVNGEPRTKMSEESTDLRVKIILLFRTSPKMSYLH
jgi:hypothetical protein